MARQYGATSGASRPSAMSGDEKKAEMIKRIEFIASAGLVLIGIIRVGAGIADIATNSDAANQLSEQVTEQYAKLEEKKAIAESTPPNIKEVKAAVSSAAEAGKEVCDLQNQLGEWTRKEKAEGKETLYKEHQIVLEKFRPYFPKNSVRDDIMVTWCEYGTWYFDSTYSFDGQTMPGVVWRCYANDDTKKEHMLAYVIAQYNETTQKFSNASIAWTEWAVDAKKKAGESVTPIAGETEEVVVTIDATEDVGIIETAETVETVETVESEETPTEIVIEISPEPEYFYGWSTQYGTWGYFDINGRFLTEDQYEQEVGIRG